MDEAVRGASLLCSRAKGELRVSCQRIDARHRRPIGSASGRGVCLPLEELPAAGEKRGRQVVGAGRRAPVFPRETNRIRHGGLLLLRPDCIDRGARLLLSSGRFFASVRQRLVASRVAARERGCPLLSAGQLSVGRSRLARTSTAREIAIVRAIFACREQPQQQQRRAVTWLDRMPDDDGPGLSVRQGSVDVLDPGRPFVIKSNGLFVMCGIGSEMNVSLGKYFQI